jgi:hypothetical protein
MTDAIALLTADHRVVEGLLSEIEGVTDPDPKVVNRIVKALSVHDAIE